jgi:hypothetical protein
MGEALHGRMPEPETESAPGHKQTLAYVRSMSVPIEKPTLQTKILMPAGEDALVSHRRGLGILAGALLPIEI